MTVLLVQIPPRPRLQARGEPVPPSHAGSGLATSYGYVLSRDGLNIDTSGHCAASLLPKAQQVVAVLGDTDVAWHAITLPKAPGSRLAAALAGVLEEALLDDAESTHLAVAPDATAGEKAWVAAVHKPWLREHLAILEKSQVWVDRVVPSSWPDEPASGHFGHAHDDAGTAHPAAETPAQLTWSHPQGVAVLPLQGTLAKALLPAAVHADMRWTTTAAAAPDAERWLGAPVTVLSPDQRCLQAARTLWNLRQFDLVKARRGSRWLRDAWRQFMGPQWRPARIGLAALVAVQLVGLNLWAAHLRDRVQGQRKQLAAILQAEFPQVRAVLDAPVQMDREVQALRLRAGQSSNNDLEPLLAAAASAWPTDQGPAQELRYEAGQLSLAAAGFTPAHLDQFAAALRGSGWQAQAQEGRVVLRPAPPGAGIRTGAAL